MRERHEDYMKRRIEKKRLIHILSCQTVVEQLEDVHSNTREKKFMII